MLTRVLRTFAYGFLGVVLALYLEQLGLDRVQIGLVLTAAVAGSVLMNVLWSIQADQFGLRKTVLTMALLVAFGGLVYALTDSFWLLLLGGFTGTISVANSEVGPFLTVEQAVLPHTAPDKFLGLHRSVGMVTKLSLLMSVDAFAGGLVVPTLLAYWLHLRWDLSPEVHPTAQRGAPRQPPRGLTL